MAEAASDDSQVTVWLGQLRGGSDEAAEKLWLHCYPRMLRYSRSRLPANLRRAFDEEDVALSAFKSLCRGAEAGRFDSVADREELWKLLTCMTARKAGAYLRHEKREKRGGGKVHGESIFRQQGSANDDQLAGIENCAGPERSPENAEEFANLACGFIDELKDENVRTVALLRLQGYSVDEIAESLNCGKRTVERRLRLIRKTWLEANTEAEQ